MTTTNWSIYFNGDNECGTTPNTSAFDFSDSTSSFTIEAWVFCTNVYKAVGIVSARNSQVTEGWGLYISADKILRLGGVIGGTPWRDVPMYATVILPNTWCHIALVKDATGYTAYVNGIAGTKLALTGGLHYLPTRPLAIGAVGLWATAAEFPFIGAISDLRIVKGTAVYTANFEPPTAPLTAIPGTVLLTCQSDKFVDNSSNNAIISARGIPTIRQYGPYQLDNALPTLVSYRQHVFKQSGTFTIAHIPPGGYFDAILVGGGASGQRMSWYEGRVNSYYSNGGSGGQVLYRRVYINSPRSYAVTIGQGGMYIPGGIYGATVYGNPGTSTSISDVVSADGGVQTIPPLVPVTPVLEPLPSARGTLINAGLFADNITYYGGTGAYGNSYFGVSFGSDGGGDSVRTYDGGPSWPGYYASGQRGSPNTGGGGGGGIGNASGDGGSGIVIIRYPILT